MPTNDFWKCEVSLHHSKAHFGFGNDSVTECHQRVNTDEEAKLLWVIGEGDWGLHSIPRVGVGVVFFFAGHGGSGTTVTMQLVEASRFSFITIL